MATGADPPDRWYFTRKQLQNTPSRKAKIDEEKELYYRQQAANLIQDMGQRLSVNQLCVNTAIVFMHRFYMFHSFNQFHRNSIATAALFLAAKVEEQPRKLEHCVRVAHACLHRDAPPLDLQSETYLEQAQEVVVNESILLQTLGFNVAVEHPNTYVVKFTHMIKAAGKELAQTAYFMATNSLHMTTFCLMYKPSVVACICIHLACKWSNWEIPKSTDNKNWWHYVDPSVTEEQLNDLTSEFLQIMQKCPSRLKRKITNHGTGQGHDLIKQGRAELESTGSGKKVSLREPSSSKRMLPGELATKKPHASSVVPGSSSKATSSITPDSSSKGATSSIVPGSSRATSTLTMPASSSKATSSSVGSLSYKEYKEIKEKEKQQHQLKAMPSSSSATHASQKLLQQQQLLKPSSSAHVVQPKLVGSGSESQGSAGRPHHGHHHHHHGHHSHHHHTQAGDNSRKRTHSQQVTASSTLKKPKQQHKGDPPSSSSLSSLLNLPMPPSEPVNPPLPTHQPINPPPPPLPPTDTLPPLPPNDPPPLPPPPSHSLMR